jgi:hypothetical protein
LTIIVRDEGYTPVKPLKMAKKLILTFLKKWVGEKSENFNAIARVTAAKNSLENFG